MNKAYVVLIAMVLLFATACAQVTKFQATKFIRTEKDISTNDIIRQMPQNGTFQYDESGSNQRWYMTIPFNGVVLEELRIWEDLYLRYTKCDGKCGFEDKFTDTNNFPSMTYGSVIGYTGGSDVNGFASSSLSETFSTATFGTVTMEKVIYTDIGSGELVPVRVIFADNDANVRLQFDFYEVNTDSFTIPNVPSGCTEVDPGCFRIDVWFGLDFSGSVGSGVDDARSFVEDFSREVTMGFDRVKIGVGRYAFTPTLMCQMQSSTAAITTCINDGASAGGLTGTAHTIAMGLVEFQERGRPSARQVQIVVTDGYYNVPCTDDRYVYSITTDGSGNNVFNPGYCNCDSCTKACTYCSSNWCCVGASGEGIQKIYDDVFPLFPKIAPIMYAIGVGGGISSSNLELIAQGASERAFTVAGYGSLNSVIDSLVSALACDVPPTSLCPNDCLPGGFCCGSNCKCLIDCETLSNDCQDASCLVTTTSTDCVRTTPDDSFCTTNKECTVGSCVDSIGCIYNLDTKPCDDQNQCTVNDTCTLNGCVGTAVGGLTCDPGESCKEGVCTAGGLCQSFDKTCTDPNPDDCEYFFCDTTTDACTSEVIEEGFKCKEDDPDDPCTVFVCQSGLCVANTRDSSDCQGGEGVPPGAIAGSVAGGISIVAIAALALLALLAALLCLCLIVGLIAALIIVAALIATAGVGVQTTALATAVEGNLDVQVNPGHIEAATEAVSPLFEE